MDVIIVEDSPADALLIERLIGSLGHTVRSARSGGKAVELMKERLPNILVTDGMLPELSGEALTRLVRSQEAARYVYVIFVSSRSDPEMRKAAFAAGADEFVPKPIERDELVSRLRVADRIVHLETRLRGKVKELETALRRLDAAAQIAGSAAMARANNKAAQGEAEGDTLVPRELAEKPSWRRIESIVQRMLSEFSQKELTPIPLAADFKPAFARAITLTSVALVTEIRFTITVEKPSLTEIASGLFGPELDDALMEDTLAELSNLAMGGVKAAFAEDSVTLTSGLPMSVAPEQLEANALHRREQLFGGPNVRIGLRLEVSRCPTKRVRSFELSDGMILAAPVTTDGGMLLVPSGVRLVTHTIERITKTLPNGNFEVIAPAA